jgi:hypothetical protein
MVTEKHNKLQPDTSTQNHLPQVEPLIPRKQQNLAIPPTQHKEAYANKTRADIAMLPQGRGKSYTHTYPNASDKHDHTTPREYQDSKNHKDVLHNSNSRGDYTSSTHSLIIQYNRSPKTGKKPQQYTFGNHPPPN